MAKVETIKNVKHMPNTKLERKIKHSKCLTEADEEKVVNFYNELVPGDSQRVIDIDMVVKEAFPKFEETIGKESFDKVKKYFGIGIKSRQKNIKEFEIKNLIANLRTVENAQYYITGYKQMVRKMADKLLNAPEGMTDLEKAKIIRMFFIIFAESEIFLEDYLPKKLPNGKYQAFFSEVQALTNNKKMIGPEELFDIFGMKVQKSSGYFYDMMVLQFKRMYHLSRNYKRELEEVLAFSELKYDSNTEKFSSVNKCMLGATFGTIRNLKKKLFEIKPRYPLELFCNKNMIETKIDITDLYVIYKSFKVYSWKEIANKKEVTYKSLSGSRFIEKQQIYYEVFDDFLVADDNEAGRWMALFEYIAEKEMVVKTQLDGNGGNLTETEYYNVGILFETFKYAINAGYLSPYTKVIQDFEVAKKLLSLDGAEEKFLKLKRGEVNVAEMRGLLGIDEEFEENVLQVKNKEILDEQKVEKPIDETDVAESNEPDNNLVNLVQSVIKFAISNNYVTSKKDVDVSLIENVFIPGNEDIINKFLSGEIDEIKFKKKIGFEEEFAEAYFNVDKFDIKSVENKLQEIKKCSKKDQIRKSKLVVSLYCYIVKNTIACGPKHKPAKRNKGLKPEILEGLIS